MTCLRAFLSGLLPVLAFAFQQQPAGFTISGMMVEHATNRPLSGVLVVLSANGHPGWQLSGLTDNDGRFSFINLPAAKYSLMAMRPGERQIHGFQGTEGFSTGIVTGPGMNTGNLNFPLDAPASISGTVVDENGDPVRQASVLLLRKSVSSGQEQVTMASRILTRSSGRFRFPHLSPGIYFIAVQARPWYAQQLQSGAPEAEKARELDVAYPVTYYGNTSDGAAAAPITLAEGASVTVQIDVRAVPAVHVSLTGMSPTEGGGWSMGFNATTEGPGGFPIQTPASVACANNSCELTGFAPGRYTVEIPHSFQSRERSKRTVDLTDGSTISVQNRTPTSVSGRVVFEGMEHPPKGAGVMLSDGRQSFNTQVQQDGSFSFSSVPPTPGRYEVYVHNAPGSYVRSVAAKGAAASGDTIEIADGASIQLLIDAGKGVLSNLDGIALKDGKPAAAAMVLLLPHDLYRSALIRRDQSDSDGTFTLPNATPGRYTLLAIDDGRDLAYQDPAVIKPYLSQGQTIDLPLKDNARVKVAVIARKR